MSDDILSDKPELVPHSAHPWEPWRCSCCNFFVYNVNEKGYPAPGAPCPRYISKEFPITCNLCWSLYVALDKSEYFTKLSREDRDSAAERAKRIKKLKPGENYFPGD